MPPFILPLEIFREEWEEASPSVHPSSGFHPEDLPLPALTHRQAPSPAEHPDDITTVTEARDAILHLLGKDERP